MGYGYTDWILVECRDGEWRWYKLGSGKAVIVTIPKEKTDLNSELSRGE